jgi:hypothetical protein
VRLRHLAAQLHFRKTCDDGSSMAMARHVAFVLVPLAMLLADCANQQHPDPQAKEDKAAQQAATKEIGSIDDARCQSFGFQPGSAGYAQCRKDFDNERKQLGVKE